MFRILGFVVGSIASIAALVLMVGMPSFHVNGDSMEEGRFDVVIQQLKQKQQSPDRPESVGSALPDESPDQSVRTIVAEAPQPAPNDLPDIQDTHAEAGSGPQPAEHADTMQMTRTPDSTVPAIADVVDDHAVDSSLGLETPADETPVNLELSQVPGWQSFWNPFRSEIAAQGFVRRLENVTGLDYRVVKVKNGVYEVAFSYNDDDERSSKLTQIAAATGLDLSDVGQ